MTGVFATIANRGRAASPRGIREIRLRGDETALLRETGGEGEQVLSERSAGLLTTMLRQVIESGTGRRARLADRDAAGKTGTTQAAHPGGARRLVHRLHRRLRRRGLDGQ
jgi:penicillin-binding protein 1A